MQEKLGKGGLMPERPVKWVGSARQARKRRFNARKACVNGSEEQEKLGKGGLMHEGPV